MIRPSLSGRRRRVALRRGLGRSVVRRPGVPGRGGRGLHLLLHRRGRGLVRVLRRRGAVLVLVLVLEVGGRVAPLVVLGRVRVAGVGRVVRRRGAGIPVGGRRRLRRRRVAGTVEAALVVVRVHGGGAERKATGRTGARAAAWEIGRASCRERVSDQV